MTSLVRFLTEDDHQAFKDAVRKNIKKCGTKKLWLRHIDWGKGEKYLLSEDHGLSSVVIADTYVLIFNTFIPWYSSKEFFQELFLIKIYDDVGTMKDVNDAIDYICRSLNLVGAMVGTAFAKSDKALIYHFEKNGFKQVATNLYKDYE
jgi:hypothetical protein